MSEDNHGQSVGQPLQGLRIIDFTHDWSGPHASRLLADYGAEVIRVEYFRRLDLMRGARVRNGAYNRVTRFRQLNRNKRSLALDLKDETDRAVFLDLVAKSDAVIANARPGVIERLGVGYDVMRSRKADIILVSMAAYGQTGPDSAYAAYGGGLEAVSGLQSLTAYGKGETPRRIREMDVTNGVVAAAALMTALTARESGAGGCWVDLSQLEAPSHALLGEHLLAQSRNGQCHLPIGNRDPDRAPHGCYRCRGDDQWCVVSVTGENDWTALTAIIGQPGWAEDERFASADGRRRHHDDIDAAIQRWTEQHDKQEVMARLQAAGVTAGAVMDAADLHGDRHLSARDYFQSAASDGGGSRYPGFPFKMSRTGGVLRHIGPDLGDANESVVRELLRRPEKDVRRFSELDIGTDFDVPGQTERY